MSLKVNALAAARRGLRPHRQWEGRRSRHLLGGSALCTAGDQNWLRPLRAEQSSIRCRPHRQAEADLPQGSGSRLDRHCAGAYGSLHRAAAATRASPTKRLEHLLHPELKVHVAHCAPTRRRAARDYEVIRQPLRRRQGWEWLQRLAANTGCSLRAARRAIGRRPRRIAAALRCRATGVRGTAGGYESSMPRRRPRGSARADGRLAAAAPARGAGLH